MSEEAWHRGMRPTHQIHMLYASKMSIVRVQARAGQLDCSASKKSKPHMLDDVCVPAPVVVVVVVGGGAVALACSIVSHWPHDQNSTVSMMCVLPALSPCSELTACARTGPRVAHIWHQQTYVNAPNDTMMPSAKTLPPVRARPQHQSIRIQAPCAPVTGRRRAQVCAAEGSHSDT